LDCAARDLEGTAHEAVKACTGLLLCENGNGCVCWMHPFRLGKNPYRTKRTPAPDLGKKGAEVLARYRRGQQPEAASCPRNADFSHGKGVARG
jgi:hypothetical protein